MEFLEERKITEIHGGNSGIESALNSFSNKGITN